MGINLTKKLELARARSERLKKARDEAERLLEEKSRELYNLNRELAVAHKNLKIEVDQATYELSVSNKRLQRTLDERLRFIAQMSHEVRTPLNAITGLSELLLKTTLSDVQYDYADTVNTAARSLMVLLSDMLDITKIEAGKLVLKPVALDMRRIHRNLVAMFRLEAENKGLLLELEVDESVPQFVKLDKGRYRQILNNLVSNAIKYTDSGSIRVKVRFLPQHSMPDVGEIKVEVIDTGVGIPPKQIQQIFNAYAQLGNPKSGVGLGLAICSQLCALMHGQIECRSKLGVGSTFEVTIPAMAVAEVESCPVSSLVSRVASERFSPRILVAEDNPINQKVLAAQLAQLGQSAEFVHNGEEVLQKLKTGTYDVVFLDIVMPVMDGEETIKAIRRATGEIASQYCIALTASNFDDQEQRMIALGFDGFLSKPLGLDTLATTLAALEARLEDAADDGKVVITPFDSSYFKKNFGDAWESVFTDLAETFLTHSEESLTTLYAAIDAGQHGLAAKISHSLKGGAASMGEVELADLFSHVEQEPDSIKLNDWRDDIESVWATASARIRQELKRIKSQ